MYTSCVRCRGCLALGFINEVSGIFVIWQLKITQTTFPCVIDSPVCRNIKWCCIFVQQEICKNKINQWTSFLAQRSMKWLASFKFSTTLINCMTLSFMWITSCMLHFGWPETSLQDKRLHQLGLKLQKPVAPVANYVAYRKSGDVVYISGQIPKELAERVVGW